MAARLEVDERQRRSLLADVSHELRTPLAVAPRGPRGHDRRRLTRLTEAHLAAAVDQIAMLTKLVEDLRTLALAEGGTLPLHKEPTDLTILAREAAASFVGPAYRAGVQLQVQMPEDLPLVDLDPLRIREVLGNLVANALRYAPRGSGLDRRGDEPEAVRISITDAGPGIAPEVLPHLFERFARSEDSRGSGLGLAIARGWSRLTAVRSRSRRRPGAGPRSGSNCRGPTKAEVLGRYADRREHDPGCGVANTRGADGAIEDVEIAEPRAGEVRVRILGSGVCHSDLHVRDGDWPRPLPMAMGHEGAGVVEAVGSGVSLRVGQPVALSWLVPCGRCRSCRAGRPWACLASPSFTHRLAADATALGGFDGGPSCRTAGSARWPRRPWCPRRPRSRFRTASIRPSPP